MTSSKDKHNIMLRAKFPNCRQVTGLRRNASVVAHHRFHDDGGDLTAVLLQRCLHEADIVPG